MDKKKFFDCMRLKFGIRDTEQVRGMDFLLSKLENETRITDIAQKAYVLATVYHETAATMLPIEEYGKGRGRYYGRRRGVYGKRYYGRGYVQLTHMENYRLLGNILGYDLVQFPEKALDPEIAYNILIIGMKAGHYTGKKLDDYIKGSKKDYRGARRIVNGMDRASLIAGYAKKFEGCLRVANE